MQINYCALEGIVCIALRRASCSASELLSMSQQFQLRLVTDPVPPVDGAVESQVALPPVVVAGRLVADTAWTPLAPNSGGLYMARGGRRPGEQPFDRRPANGLQQLGRRHR